MPFSVPEGGAQATPAMVKDLIVLHSGFDLESSTLFYVYNRTEDVCDDCISSERFFDFAFFFLKVWTNYTLPAPRWEADVAVYGNKIYFIGYCWLKENSAAVGD